MSEKEKILTASPGKKTPLDFLRDRYSAAESQRVFFKKKAAALKGEIAYETWKAKGFCVGGVAVENGKRYVVSSMTRSLYLMGYAIKKDGKPVGLERKIFFPSPDMENPA